MADSFKSHLPVILGGTTATVFATLGTSFLGYGGTILGVALGSLLTGGGAFFWERLYRKAGKRAKLIAEATKAKGSPLTHGETQKIHAIVDAGDKVTHRGIPWKFVGAGAGTVFLASVAVLAFIELGTGKPVSAVVQNQPAHGFVAPVQSTSPQTSFSPTPSSTATPTVSPTATVTVTPTTVYTAAPSPAVSTTPAATPSSSTQTATPHTPSSTGTSPSAAGTPGP